MLRTDRLAGLGRCTPSGLSGEQGGKADRAAANHAGEVGDVSSGEEKTLASPTGEARG